MIIVAPSTAELSAGSSDAGSDARQTLIVCSPTGSAGVASACVSVAPDSVLVRRLFKDSEGTSRYLIRDVGPTGLEYAMFVDSRDTTLPIAKVGRKIGRVSKTDMRNIRL